MKANRDNKKGKRQAAESRSALEQVYREQIIDHYRNPRRFGQLAACDVRRRESNFSCGDDLDFFLKFKGDRIADIRFNGQGCALSVAAASMLAETVVGMSLAAVEKLSEVDVLKMLGVGNLQGSRLRCATLGLKGIQTAVADWKKAQ